MLTLHIKLPFNQNHVMFLFAAIALENLQKVCYRYQLEWLETEWSAPTMVTELDYQSLPYREYRFKVSAAGANGIWSKPTVYSFTINPPWYRKSWF